MRCRGCDYALWNLPPGNCPECGLAFRPSDYEFVPNAVRFCCPCCKQHYFGTSLTGHLEPESFVCVSCANAVSMDEMLVLPAEGVPESSTARDDMPWVNRERHGFLRAMRKTFYRSLGAPGRLVGQLPIEPKPGAAFVYSLCIGALFTAIILLWMGALFAIISAGAGAPPPGQLLAVFGGMAVMSFGAWLVLVPLWALLGHLVLLVTGKREGGLGRTFECACYASSAAFLGAVIPGCGFYIWWIWPIVAFAIMLHARQKVHGVRAAFAALTLPLLFMLSYAGFVVMVFANTAATANTGAITANARVGSVERGDVSALGVSLEAFRRREGRAPVHAIELIKRDTTPSAFIATNSMLKLDQTSPLGLSLDTLSRAPPAEQLTLIDNALNAMPTDAVAHRVGDYVFTYHGFDPKGPGSGRLWVIVRAPDPAAPSPIGTGFVTCLRADGTVDQFPSSAFSPALASQNAMRSSLGAPLIPNPYRIRAGQPATGP